MPGNGDERQQNAWERVEAKLDRQGEEIAAMGKLLKLIADKTLEFGHRLGRIERRLDRIEGRLDRIEGEGDELRGEIEALERRLEALEKEL